MNFRVCIVEAKRGGIDESTQHFMSMNQVANV